MPLTYNAKYFCTSQPNILQNNHLREPQQIAYSKLFDHFITKDKRTHAIIVLPTGVGKTGLMGLLPYNIAKGRVLIITPQLVIKDAVADSLDPDTPGNFWQSRKIFTDRNELPTVSEYTKETKKEWLEAANIVILNIHKLQSRLDSSLLNAVDENFFDMIIIDEAHHSTASTWVNAINYFNNAKVVKLTGTLFRSDKDTVVGDVIYDYKLSSAMARGYVKSLENITYIPEQLYLTIDKDDSKIYTIEEIYQKGKDDEWISRSVAYSRDCSEKIVDKSLELLYEKKKGGNNVPHKIIAIACSIYHAEQIKEIYEGKRVNCAIVHCEMDKKEIESSLKDIENHRVEVVIHVAKLGEGYDHPFLSIAAIFRPFRNLLPYAQFIGRILRIIPETDIQTASDNIGQVVVHKNLKLDDLWAYYKKNIEESNTIKYIEDIDVTLEDQSDNNTSTRNYDNSIGLASEHGNGTTENDVYMTTELIKRRREEAEKEKTKIEELIKILNVDKEHAKKIIDSHKSSDSQIKNPQKYFLGIGKDIDVRIKEDIVPRLISDYNINKSGDELQDCSPLFGSSKYSWILKRKPTNAGMLAIYFNYALSIKIGRKKQEWTSSDYEIAKDRLTEIEEFVEEVLREFMEER